MSQRQEPKPLVATCTYETRCGGGIEPEVYESRVSVCLQQPFQH